MLVSCVSAYSGYSWCSNKANIPFSWNCWSYISGLLEKKDLLWEHPVVGNELDSWILDFEANLCIAHIELWFAVVSKLYFLIDESYTVKK